MGTKNNPGNFDCYAAALPDEPMFHLLGRDPAFPATVRFWMRERSRLGKHESRDDLDKLAEAGTVATKAEDWRASLVAATAEGDPMPWHNRPHVDSYDRGPPVRAESDTWSGDQGGPVVSVPSFTGWHETGSYAIGLGFNKGIERLPDTLARLDREGWRFAGAVGGGGLLFERVHFLGHVQVAEDRIAPPPGTAMEALNDNLHLRAKMVVGLNQIANDLHRWADGQSFGPTRLRSTLAFVDRINGYAAELGDGLPVDMIPLPSADPARGADTSHPTVAVAPEDALDFGDPELPLGTGSDALDLGQFERLPPVPGVYSEDQGKRPCDPSVEDCTGMGRGLQP